MIHGIRHVGVKTTVQWKNEGADPDVLASARQATN